jgi:hypothetical protein
MADTQAPPFGSQIERPSVVAADTQAPPFGSQALRLSVVSPETIHRREAVSRFQSTARAEEVCGVSRAAGCAARGSERERRTRRTDRVRRVVLDMAKAPFLRNEVPAGGSAGDLSILLLTGRGEVVVCCGSEIDVEKLPPELDPFPRRPWGES